MPTYIRLQTIWFIALALIFGSLSGIIGAVIVGTQAMSVPFFGQLSFSDLTADQQLIIDQPRSVVVEQDIQLRQIDNSVMPTLANIYATPTGADTPLERALTPSARLGQAVVLTSDGWIMTSSSTISHRAGTYTVVGYQSKQYELTAITADERTGFVFGKINATNLPVIQMAALESISVGQTVALISGRSTIEVAHVTRIGYHFASNQTAVLSSDRLAKEIFIDETLGREHQGAVVATLKGQIVGIVNGDRIIPLDNARPSITSVLERKPAVRPALGVSYFDLAHVEGLISYGDRGALIATEPARTTPVAGKLRAGDVITHVDDIELNVYRGLAEQIQQYRPGTNVELRLRRGSETVTVDIILK